MAQWVLIDDGAKSLALINLNLVPHIEKTPGGRIFFHIAPEHKIIVDPGPGAEKVWDYLILNTVKKS